MELLKLKRENLLKRNCPECGGIMYWDGSWECSNCLCEINTDEDDNDGIIEG